MLLVYRQHQFTSSVLVLHQYLNVEQAPRHIRTVAHQRQRHLELVLDAERHPTRVNLEAIKY